MPSTTCPYIWMKAAIAVIGEALVAALARQPLDHAVVEPEVEHGVHHARHRDARAGAHRDEQRVVGIAERGAERALDPGERAFDLFPQLGRIGFAVLIKMGADLGGDREAGRHRQPEIAHLGEAGALAAEQVPHVGAPLGGAAAKPVDPFLSSAAHPSICEKSATWFIIARMRDSSRSRFSRSAGSSVLTVTLSKNSSTGRRKLRQTPPSRLRNCSRVKEGLQRRAPISSSAVVKACSPQAACEHLRIRSLRHTCARPGAPRSRRCSRRGDRR